MTNERRIVTIRTGKFSYAFERLEDRSKLFSGAQWDGNKVVKDAIVEVQEGLSMSDVLIEVATRIGDKVRSVNDDSDSEYRFRAGYLVGMWDERYKK